MWTAVVTIASISLAAGLLLAWARSRLPENDDAVADRVNDLLPQTQCGQCGFAGCRPYANAIVAGSAEIDRCPPGGYDTIRRLAELLGREPRPLAVPGSTTMSHSVAIIDEALCIGCLHCRDICPVDAIVGAQRCMHTVISSECTGCELCLPACPVDCIDMVTRA
ncbi:MAG: electron transport complex subunit RsxB [Gammaproteobacteria bacterium]|nr:electron transport complex subunit RsxB [Gammaproteobacteria bacterium]MDH4254945.1 electron transport complex subunit RsxB [Gammaproteobacteria bacterium]MDH5308844.1 electron transport complex subunit RsxB [Gammaproteobacteria bacterium]